VCRCWFGVAAAERGGAVMLTVAKVTAAQAAGYAEYLEGRSVASWLGDYYLKDGDRVEAQGRWVGGALAMGADGDEPVSGEQLRALMAVQRPDNGLPLRASGAGGEAVAAIDATFSAPKSVSAVWALADPELRSLVEQAHERAIDRALAHAVQVVAMVRERIDRDVVVHAGARGVVATGWRHTTARAVRDQPPDPQLHSHLLLHAAVRKDGRVVAIDSRFWLIHRREIGAAYRTELAHELAQLGFRIERGTGRGGRYFEIEGVPRELIDRWSSRHWQVQEAIKARLRDKQTAVLSPAEDRLLAIATRATKDQLSTSADLDRHWTRTAASLGFSARLIRRLRAAGRPPEPAAGVEVAARLTEFDATFTEREARAVALETSTGASIAGVARDGAASGAGAGAVDDARPAGGGAAHRDGRGAARGRHGRPDPGEDRGAAVSAARPRAAGAGQRAIAGAARGNPAGVLWAAVGGGRRARRSG
jgi:conjugative relaxase-like TrwC/TraI family protein